MGSNSGPLDPHLLPDRLPTALRGPVTYVLGAIKMSPVILLYFKELSYSVDFFNKVGLR